MENTVYIMANKYGYYEDERTAHGDPIPAMESERTLRQLHRLSRPAPPRCPLPRPAPLQRIVSPPLSSQARGGLQVSSTFSSISQPSSPTSATTISSPTALDLAIKPRPDIESTPETIDFGEAGNEGDDIGRNDDGFEDDNGFGGGDDFSWNGDGNDAESLVNRDSKIGYPLPTSANLSYRDFGVCVNPTPSTESIQKGLNPPNSASYHSSRNPTKPWPLVSACPVSCSSQLGVPSRQMDFWY